MTRYCMLKGNLALKVSVDLTEIFPVSFSGHLNG